MAGRNTPPAETNSDAERPTAWLTSRAEAKSVNVYRQRAAEAEYRAAQAKNPFIKSAFEEATTIWLVLAQQTEWIDSQKASPLKKNSDLAS